MQDLSNNNSIIGLDLGSAKLCASICTFDKDGQIHISGIGTSISEGIRRGRITNKEMLKNCIKRAITRAERVAKINPDKIVVGINSTKYLTKRLKASIRLPEDREQISAEDKKEVIKKAIEQAKEDDFQIIHSAPVNFKVNKELCKTDPVGLFGKVLEIEIIAIQNEKKEIETIQSICNELNIALVGIIPTPIATSKITITKKELNENTMLIDIGGGTTQLAVYKNNKLVHYAVFPLGGDRISSDIQVILNTSSGEAERLKILYGKLNQPKYSQQDNIEFLKTEAGEEEKCFTNEKMLNEIIIARLEEIFNIVKSEIRNLPNHFYPNLAVIAGGTSIFKGFEDIATKYLGLPIRIGLPKDKKEVIESPNYASSISLVVHAINTRLIDLDTIKYPSPKKLSTVINKWFKDFF